MEAFTKVLQFLSERTWPIVTLIALILFRKPLSEILSRTMRLNVKAGKFSLNADMRRVFARHISPSMVDQLVQDPEKLQATPQRTLVTVLYSKLRGGTHWSEVVDPDVIARYLRLYLTAMTKVVFDLGGTLDNYQGDALTAYWGAPIAYPDAAERACTAALKMLEEVKTLNPILQKEGLPNLSLNVAVTTGRVVVGNLGSEQQPSYSVLGEALELLPRLAGLCDQFNTNILLTEYTHERVKHRFSTVHLDQIIVKGKTEPIHVYRLLG